MVLLLIFVLTNTKIYADNLYAEASSHSPGMIKIYINGGNQPYSIYKSLDKENYEFIMEITSNTYTEYGLENGQTYYYKIVDKVGNETIGKHTIPFTQLQIYPLEVIQLGDTYVQLNWTSFYSKIDLYVNETFYGTYTESSVTVTNLSPDTEYTFYFLNTGGERSNKVKVTTSSELNKIINRLDKLLNDLIVDDNYRIDSNNNGIVDGFEPIYNKAQEIINTPIIKYPENIGNIIKDKTIFTESIEDINKTNAFEDFLKFEIEFVPGLKINLFDSLNEYINEIKLIRKILVCILYCNLFFYFVQKLIPKLHA